MSDPVRYIQGDDLACSRPVYAVWELTLACDLKCQHCGSRAGKPRPNELSTAECLDLVDQLARLGMREVALIGGEAYTTKYMGGNIRDVAHSAWFRRVPSLPGVDYGCSGE